MAYFVSTVQVCIPEAKSWTVDQVTVYSDQRFVCRWQRARANPEFFVGGATHVAIYYLFLDLKSTL
jgi:hypothetical protein